MSAYLIYEVENLLNYITSADLKELDSSIVHECVTKVKYEIEKQKTEWASK